MTLTKQCNSSSKEIWSKIGIAELVKNTKQVQTNLKTTHEVVIVRSRDFDKILKLPFKCSANVGSRIGNTQLLTHL